MASSTRQGHGFLRTAGAIVGGLGLVGLAAGGAALARGSVRRTMPVLRRYDVPIQGDVPEVMILQVADLHLFLGQDFLLRFLSDVTASERFDVVVATRDNFGSMDALDMVMDAYRPLLSYPGAFVLGPNDYYSPIPKRWSRYLSQSRPHPARVVLDLPYLPIVRRMRWAGWIDLSNTFGTISLPVGTVSLLDTNNVHIHRDRVGMPASSWAAPDVLHLGITYAPYTRVVSALTSAGSDLILAGHTHDGQTGIPGAGAIIMNCDISRPYAKGLKRQEAPDGTEAWLRVSAGLGTSCYVKIRIATCPEASLLHVHPAQEGVTTAGCRAFWAPRGQTICGVDHTSSAHSVSV